MEAIRFKRDFFNARPSAQGRYERVKHWFPAGLREKVEGVFAAREAAQSDMTAIEAEFGELSSADLNNGCTTSTGKIRNYAMPSCS